MDSDLDSRPPLSFPRERPRPRRPRPKAVLTQLWKPEAGQPHSMPVRSQAYNQTAKRHCSFTAQWEEKYLEKCQPAPLPGPTACPRKLLADQSSREPQMPCLPSTALLVCGRHGSALLEAPPAPRGQTQRQPGPHLPALPHQALKKRHSRNAPLARGVPLTSPSHRRPLSSPCQPPPQNERQEDGHLRGLAS